MTKMSKIKLGYEHKLKHNLSIRNLQLIFQGF